MRPIEAAWRVLKEEPFDLRETLEANTDPNDQLGLALAQARAKPPAPPLQLEKLPPMPRTGGAPSTNALAPTRQSTLSPELTASARESQQSMGGPEGWKEWHESQRQV
tara:strand:- start:1391 stop:1714 length:324 start_codon:yes stop_codon:yes gene_type:complete